MRLGEDGVARVFEYKLLSGQAGASPFWQMLQHVVNHASYHRGQVTTMLRQLGAAPAKPMDMIAYLPDAGIAASRLGALRSFWLTLFAIGAAAVLVDGMARRRAVDGGRVRGVFRVARGSVADQAAADRSPVDDDPVRRAHRFICRHRGWLVRFGDPRRRRGAGSAKGRSGSTSRRSSS